MTPHGYEVHTIGVVVSPVKDPSQAPLQGDESDIESEILIYDSARRAAAHIPPGARVVVLTWLHLADRTVLAVHPRGDTSRPLTGVFSTRSPDRPNPIGLHEVEIVAVEADRLRVRGLEAIDGTPVLDLKPVLEPRGAR